MIFWFLSIFRSHSIYILTVWTSSFTVFSGGDLLPSVGDPVHVGHHDHGEHDLVLIGLFIPLLITTLPGGTPPDELSAQAEDDLCGPQHGDHVGGLGDGHGQGNDPERQECHDGRHQEGDSGGER